MIKTKRLKNADNEDSVKYNYSPYSKLTREFMDKIPKLREYLTEYDKANNTQFLNEFNQEVNSMSKFFETVDNDYFNNNYDN